MNEFETRIAVIGREVVACRRSCEGVYSNPADGVIPRGLVLEPRDPSLQGAIFLGMNPGKGDDRERARLKADPSYEAMVDFMHECRLPTHQYYRRLRSLADACDIGGDLLWTELAKCQSTTERHGSLPVETYRTCATAFLQREIEVFPASSAIFAVGWDAFFAAAYLFLDRAIVGVTHPTGSWGKQWVGMFVDGVLRPEYQRAVANIIKDRRAAWLGDEVQKGNAPG